MHFIHPWNVSSNNIAGKALFKKLYLFDLLAYVLSTFLITLKRALIVNPNNYNHISGMEWDS